MEYAVELDNVTKEYKDFKLADISLRVPKGCIMGLIGENGAGKTTIIKAILDLITIDSGTIKVLGEGNFRNNSRLKEKIGVVFDECCFSELQTLESIGKSMKYLYKQWDSNAFKYYTTKFDLPDKKILKEYSRGMKMKLSIAVALSHNAELLIMDEATSGLDPIVRDKILESFLEYIQDENHTILLSSHITTDLEKVADYITFVHKGKMVFSESKDDIIYNYGIIKCQEKDYRELDKGHIKGVRKNRFGWEVMIDNRLAMEKQGKYVIDRASIDEIMLFQHKEVV